MRNDLALSVLSDIVLLLVLRWLGFISFHNPWR